MARKKQPTQPSEEELLYRKLSAETLRSELLLNEAIRNEMHAEAESQSPFVYTFYDGVTSESVKECMAEIDEYARHNPGEPITIRLNSPGGFVIDGLALYDFLQDVRKRGHMITVIALGQAASMGGILLQAGDRRVMGRNAFLLIHEVHSGDEGKTSERKDSIEFSRRLEQKLLAILAKRSKLSVREIKALWERKDWWLTAGEAVKLGFADEIL